MVPMLAEFRAVAEELSYQRSQLPVVSAVTGDVAGGEELSSPEYWVEHARRSVRFADAVRTLEAQGVTRYLELGPDSTLTVLAESALEGDGRVDRDPPVFVPVLRKDRPEAGSVLSALAGVFVSGGVVDWSLLFGDGGGETTELPTYVFQHQRFWPTVADPRPVTNPGGEIDARFWEAVEREDLEGLAGALDLEEEVVGAVLPALTSWRRQSAERAAVDGLRYRVHWAPVSGVPRDARLSDRWLVVVPEDCEDDAWFRSVREALTAAGGDVEWWTCDPHTGRAGLAARLGDVGAVAGVVSLLALSGGSGEGGLPLGVSGSVALVQALGDAGVRAPLWVLTRGAVAVGGVDGPVDAVQGAVWGLGRVAALEAPDRWGGLVDLPSDLNNAARSALAAVLGGVGDEDQVAVRASGVFGRRLVRVASGGSVDGVEGGWSPRGTVLVTGG
ncbi:polyketide synthase, partial [Streptomyces sp. NPDC051776]